MRSAVRYFRAFVVCVVWAFLPAVTGAGPATQLLLFNPNLSPAPGLVRVTAWTGVGNVTGTQVDIVGWPFGFLVVQVFTTQEACSILAFARTEGGRRASVIKIDVCDPLPSVLSVVALPKITQGSLTPFFGAGREAYDAANGVLYVYCHNEYQPGQFGPDQVVAVDTLTGIILANVTVGGAGNSEPEPSVLFSAASLFVNINGDPNQGRRHQLDNYAVPMLQLRHSTTVRGAYLSAMFRDHDGDVGSVIGLGPGTSSAGTRLAAYRVDSASGAAMVISPDLGVDSRSTFNCFGSNATDGSILFFQLVDGYKGNDARFVSFNSASGTIEWKSTPTQAAPFEAANYMCALIAW